MSIYFNQSHTFHIASTLAMVWFFFSGLVDAASFRQEFQVYNGREFDERDLFVFETLYRQFTYDFIPVFDAEASEEIQTTCTVNKQSLLKYGERKLEHHTASHIQGLRGRHLYGSPRIPMDDIGTLIVDFTMQFESQNYNVTEYPKLFQNWTNSNLDVVLDRLQSFQLNVDRADPVKRKIVVFPPTQTSRPTETGTSEELSSSSPTPVEELPTQSMLKSHWDRWITAIIFALVCLIVLLLAVVIGPNCYHNRKEQKEQETNRSDDFRSCPVSLMIVMMVFASFFHKRKQNQEEVEEEEEEGTKTTGEPDCSVSSTQGIDSQKLDVSQVETRSDRYFGTMETISIQSQ